jgi:hypothetical protein
LEVTPILLETIFAPFVKERPICVMARAVLERLLDAPRLDALLARTAQQQYAGDILFSSLVQLMSEVVLGVHPTVHTAYQANKEAIKVLTTALYNKLDRIETGVAAALVRDSAALAESVVKALRAVSHNSCENMSPMVCEYRINTGRSDSDHVADSDYRWCNHSNISYVTNSHVH